MTIVKTPPEYLADYIQFFYSVYASAPQPINAVHRRLPDGTLDIVFNLGRPVLLSPDGIRFSEMPDVALTGLYQNRKFIQYKGTVHLIGVVFKPGFAHLFVNDNLEWYRESVLDASLVFGNDILSVPERLRHIEHESEKHRFLEAFLYNYLQKKNGDHYASKISGIVQQIHASEGNIALSALYKNHFMSERTFRRKFNEYVGLSPKQYATIIRIKSFSKRYELAKSTYTDICNELGYTDPSHFGKDFQKIAGTSPTAYFGQLNKIGAEFIHLI